MDKNSIQNFENVKKLTKYQIRLAGASNDKQNTYKYKVDEYSNKLEKNGLNSSKILTTIQTGGDPFAELRAQQAALDAQIKKLAGKVDTTVLDTQLREITDSATKAKTKYDTVTAKYDTLADSYGKFASETLFGNYDIQNKLKKVKMGDLPDLTDKMTTITDSLQLGDKGDADIDELIKTFIVDTHIAKIGVPEEILNLARTIVGKKFGDTIDGASKELEKRLIEKDRSQQATIQAAVARAVAKATAGSLDDPE